VIQEEMEDLDEGENARVESLLLQYRTIDSRVTELIDRLQSSIQSIPTKYESGTGSEPKSINLTEIQLPMFDGTIEEWEFFSFSSFYDTFISTIDRNEKLTSVQKYHYLRSCVTAKAARSLLLLNVAKSNYSIAINVLKEKFDCYRQVCMRHWHLIRDYPKLTKETPKAIDDFLETVKVNLRALEKLGESVTSNVILVDLFTSKLPSSTIRKWHRTLPDKKCPHAHI
jgi:hypothetical protein